MSALSPIKDLLDQWADKPVEKDDMINALNNAINESEQLFHYIEQIASTDHNYNFIKQIENKKHRQYLYKFLIRCRRSLDLDDIPHSELNEELCLVAVEKDGHNLKFVPWRFRTEEICLLALETYSQAIYDVPLNIINEKMCEISVTDDGYNIENIPTKFITEELCELAMRQYPEAEQYAPIGSSIHNNYLMKKALL